MVDKSVISARIAERLKWVRVTERAASMAATGQPDALRFIRTRGVMPSAERLDKIAHILQTTSGYLLGLEHDSDDAWHTWNARLQRQVESKEIRLSQAKLKKDAARVRGFAEQTTLDRQHFLAKNPTPTDAEKLNRYWIDPPHDVPLFRTSPGSGRLFLHPTRGGDVTTTLVTSVGLGDEIDAVIRPEALRDARDCYAVRACHGAAQKLGFIDDLIYVDPSWPVAANGLVAIFLRPEDADSRQSEAANHSGVADMILGQLKDVTSADLTIHLFDPPSSINVGRWEATACYRILPFDELQTGHPLAR